MNGGRASGTSPNITRPPIDNAGPMVAPQGLASNRIRSTTRPGVSREAFGRDEGALAWGVNEGMAGERQDPVSGIRGRIPQQHSGALGSGLEPTRRARQAGGGRHLGTGTATSDGDDDEGADGLHVGHDVSQSSRRMYNTSTSSADGWDPAVSLHDPKSMFSSNNTFMLELFVLTIEETNFVTANMCYCSSLVVNHEYIDKMLNQM